MRALTEFTSGELLALPFDMSLVRVLDGFDGPLISECVTTRGETLIRYWVDGEIGCDRHLILQVEPRWVFELFVHNVPLIELFRNAGLGMVFVEECIAVHDTKYFWCRVSDLPEEYLPQPEARLDGSLPSLFEIQEFYLGRNAGGGTIQKAARAFRRAQTVLSLFGKGGDPKGVRIEGKLNNGWVFGNLYERLRRADAVESAEVMSYAAASPGFLRMTCDERLRGLVNDSLAIVRSQWGKVFALNKDLGAWVNGHEGRMTDKTAKFRFVELSKLIGIEGDVLLDHCSGLVHAVKALRSYLNRLIELDRMSQNDEAVFIEK